jgi:hydroxymethylbilane synthase
VAEPVIRLATRGSALARAQARLVEDALLATGAAQVEVVIVETEGDRRAPDTAWGEGAFVVAIEHALLDGRADAAVHSAKDMPTEGTPGLVVAAYLERADPRDALIVRSGSPARSLDQLPRGSRIGTDSPRRGAFLLARRPDLVVHPLHGNVDTRLRRLDEGQSDALVLAAAGLQRLGRADRISQILDEATAVPAPGQGAIAVQVRADDAATAGVVARVDHRPTRIAVEAERAFLSATGGGCRAPVGALGRVVDGQLVLVGARARADGSGLARDEVRGPLDAWLTLANTLAARLVPRRVLVTRAAGQAPELTGALAGAGLVPVEVPTIAIEPLANLGQQVTRLARFDWAVVTSANGARALAGAAERARAPFGTVRWAAVGAATARALAEAGVPDVFVPSVASAEGLASELPIAPGERVVLFRGDLASQALVEVLTERGAIVEDVTVYRTVEGPSSSAPLLRSALVAGLDGLVFTSGSTIRGLASLAGVKQLRQLQYLPAVCIGERTAGVARDLGFRVAAVATSPGSQALAEAAAQALGIVPD